MKVLVDMTFVSVDNLYRSLPRVAMRFLYGINDIRRKDYCLLFEKSAAAGMHQLLPDFAYITVDLFRARNSRVDFRYLLLPFRYRKTINNSGCDILFIPGEGWFATILNFNIPRVVTVHDIKQYKKDFELANSQLGLVNKTSAFIKKFFYKKNLYRADHILTVSEFTRQDILKYFPGVNEKRIHTVHNSVVIIENSKKPNGIDTGKNFILNVNTLHQFKNPLTLIKAFEAIMDDIKEDLVLVGRKTEYWNEVLYPYIKEHNLEERITRLEDLDDSELRYLYENTNLFVTPSLHEGFGFTPVEASIYGAPVISSKSESLPEATMGLVNYYEPAADENALAEAMLCVLNYPPTKAELKRISDTYKEEYSPKHQVEQTEIIFKLAIDKI